MKLTIAQAAEYLECGERRVEELLREGHIPALKLGQHWVIPAASFYKAMEALAVSAAASLYGNARWDEKVKANAAGRPRLARSV